MADLTEALPGGEDETRKSFPYEYVKELREENGRYRRQKSEIERERDQIRVQADQRVIRAELKAEAVRAGINDPADLKLVDIAGLKLGADGEIEGAADLIAKLKQTKPYLFKSGGGTGGTSGTGTPPRPGDRQVPSAKTMTNAEFREALAKYGVKLPR